MKKMLWAVIALVLVGVAGYVGLYMPNSQDRTEAVTVTRTFLHSLIEGDAEKAAANSRGLVKLNLLNSEMKPFKCLILDDKVVAIDITGTTATVKATMEFSSDNKLNAVFYDVRLLKEKGAWQVIGLEESDPLMKGHLSSSKAIGPFTGIYQQYLDRLRENRFDDAGLLLVGRARSMHEKTSANLQNGALLDDIKDLNGTFQFQSKSVAAVTMGYTNKGNQIETLVWYYLTKEGWKIFKIEQI